LLNQYRKNQIPEYGQSVNIAIISDIHGNLEALEAVLEDIADKEIDHVICLGDCVGYGADSEAVLSRLWDEDIPAVRGNHEDALFDDSVLEWFNPQATDAILKTREMISAESRERISRWPLFIPFDTAWCVHGFPPASVHTYLFEATKEMVAHSFDSIPSRMVFVGHTHILSLVAFDGQRVRSYPLKKGTTFLNGRRYIVNVGAVGQPRDGDNSAKYVIWDIEANSLEVRFVPYDAAKAADKIRRAGLPEFLARRLL
jgi:predicted phosphodiesterase